MADLVRTIGLAFDAVAYPTGASLCSGYDDEGINEFFGNRTWQSITDPSDLAHHSCALTYFTAEAFHYFLPSFMIAGVKFPNACGNVVDAVVWSLTPPKMNPARASFMLRWRLFSSGQRNAAVEFLSLANRVEARRAAEAGYESSCELDAIIQCLRETIAA